jgi:chromatin structure-remodeling complex subunit SFH1
MQPILQAGSTTTMRSSTRRGGVVNYADPGSGDDMPDAGAIDSDDSDFVASGGTRTAIRQSRGRFGTGMSVFHAGASTVLPPVQPKVDKAELGQSYLGMIPPSKFIKPRPVAPTAHEYPWASIFLPYSIRYLIVRSALEALERQGKRPSSLVPIRVEFETETHRIRDCFVWNLYENLIKPETFAHTFCNDLDLPAVPWAETVANQIRAQLEEHEGVASMDLGIDAAVDFEEVDESLTEELPECRVVVSVGCFPWHWTLSDSWAD